MKTITIKNKQYRILDTYPRCCEYHEQGIAILMDSDGKTYQITLDAQNKPLENTLLSMEAVAYA